MLRSKVTKFIDNYYHRCGTTAIDVENMGSDQLCSDIKKKIDIGPPCISFLIFLGYHLQDQSFLKKKKLTGVPLDKAFLLLLEG